MWTMAGDDRLSDLPDKLLRRILHFAPAKEAASTRALSRRWRSQLLRSSGAVNLETRVEDYDRVLRHTLGQEERKDLEAAFFSRRDAFVSAAERALDAAADGDHVTRLSLLVVFELGPSWAKRFLNCDSNGSLSQDHGIIARLLSHRAARHVEELRLAGECLSARPGAYDDDQDNEITSNFTGVYTLSLSSLPSETLRVLDLVYCDDIVPQAAVFPRLSSLRLQRSAVHLNALQSLIDSAPNLATVHLEAILIVPADDATEAVLRCPATTVLMLDRCNWTKKDRGIYRGDKASETTIVLEIHAPRLRRFLYKGLLRQFSLSPPPPDLTRADLHFFPCAYERRNAYLRGAYRYRCVNEDPYRKPMTFWGFLHNFSSVKELKLRVNNLEDIAVVSEARRIELLPVFSNLECLQLEGMHRSKGKTAAVAIANLLRCSPALRYLRLNLTTAHHAASRQYQYVNEYLQQKFESDRDKSLDLISRCSVEPTTICLEGDVDDAEINEILGIPGLSRRSFECLQTSLRKVSLQFRLEDSNCFGIKLIKFFVENGIVLEELLIDRGNGKLCEHMQIETWISNSRRRRRSGASSFVVLPLKRGF